MVTVTQRHLLMQRLTIEIDGGGGGLNSQPRKGCDQAFHYQYSNTFTHYIAISIFVPWPQSILRIIISLRQCLTGYKTPNPIGIVATLVPLEIINLALPRWMWLEAA